MLGFFISGIVIAVSYTHLDVYKRQVGTVGTLVRQTCLRRLRSPAFCNLPIFSCTTRSLVSTFSATIGAKYRGSGSNLQIGESCIKDFDFKVHVRCGISIFVAFGVSVAWHSFKSILQTLTLLT